MKWVCSNECGMKQRSMVNTGYIRKHECSHFAIIRTSPSTETFSTHTQSTQHSELRIAVERLPAIVLAKSFR